MFVHRAPYTPIALAVLLGGSLFAAARMAPDDTRLIPFQGQLWSGSEPVSGVVALRLGLFQSAVADASCLLATPSNCPVWGEEQLDVEVIAGRFSVVLGGSNAIDDAVLAQDRLFLAIAVKGTGDDAFTLLPHKQEILPVPWAARAAAAKDYKVVGALTVGEDAWVNGDLETNGDIETNGSLRVRRAADFECPGCGSKTSLEGTEKYGRLTVQGRVLSGDSNIYLSPPGGKSVIINDSFRAAGGTATGGVSLNVQLDIRAGRDMSASGDISAVGEVTWNCPPGTSRIGNTCITGSQGYISSGTGVENIATFQAMRACHEQKKELCSLEQIELCDAVDSPTGPGECGTVTDSTASGDAVLVGGLSRYLTNPDSSRCYGGFFADRVSDCNGAAHFYCCSPVNAR